MIDLQGDNRAARTARRVVATAPLSWDIAPTVVDDATLLADEVVTNR